MPVTRPFSGENIGTRDRGVRDVTEYIQDGGWSADTPQYEIHHVLRTTTCVFESFWFAAYNKIVFQSKAGRPPAIKTHRHALLLL